MPSSRALLFLLTLVLFAGSGVAATTRLGEDELTARHYVDLLRRNQFDEIKRDADPALANADLTAVLGKMAAEFPRDEEPSDIKVLRAQVSQGAQNLMRADYSFEYIFPSAPVLVNITLQKRGDAMTVAAFSALQIPPHLNDFTLGGRNALQYIVLALVPLIPLFMLYAFIVCLRMRLPARIQWVRWAWMAAIFLGIGRFSIDWMTGVFTIQPLSLLLFGIGASRSLNGYGPWILTIGMPLGAAAFLIWHRLRTGRTGDMEISQSIP